MIQPSPHNRHPIQDADARREFYRHLFVALLIPALTLAGLFLVPVFFVNALDNTLYDACAVQFRDDRGLRVVSETGRTNTVHFYMRWHPADRWQEVDVRQRPYQLAVADCSNVLFLDEITVLYLDNQITLVDTAGQVTDVRVNAACDAIDHLRRTDAPATVSMRCENGESYHVQLPMPGASQ